MPVSLIAYLSTVVVFFAIDFVWLNFVAQKFYNAQMGDLLKENFNLPVAAGFYLVYIVGIVIFAIRLSSQGLGQLHFFMGRFLAFSAMRPMI